MLPKRFDIRRDATVVAIEKVLTQRREYRH
jgi:hypothetical protein